MRVEQPAATVEPAPGAVSAVLVTTQLQPVSLVIVEPVNVTNDRSKSEANIVLLKDYFFLFK